MRRLIWSAVVLATLWMLWWGGLSWSMNSGASGWFEARRAEGWQADVQAVASSGFPSRIDTRLEDVALADPETGLAIELPDLTLSLRALWPGDMHVLFPKGPMGLATPQGRWQVLASGAQADVNLTPGQALELEQVSVSSGPFRIETAQSLSVFGGAAANLRLQRRDTEPTYDAQLDIAEFAPGDQPRTALLIPPDWPLVFDTLRADAIVTLDRPLDRFTVEDRRPQPVRIDLTHAEAHWGDLRLRAAGSVIRDAQGFAEGSITIKAENWQSMLDIAERGGLLPANMRVQAENVLRSLAGATGSTSDLDITLRFEGGLTRLGFVPLGPAPGLRIR